MHEMCKIVWNLSKPWVQKQPPCFSDVCSCWLQHYITVNAFSITTQSVWSVECWFLPKNQHSTRQWMGVYPCTFDGQKSNSDIHHIKASLDDGTSPAWIPDEFWESAYPQFIRSLVTPCCERVGMTLLNFPALLLTLSGTFKSLSNTLYLLVWVSLCTTLTHLWVCSPQDQIHSQEMWYNMSSNATVASGPLALGITLFKNAYSLSASSNKPGAAESSPSILRHYRVTLFAKMKCWCWIHVSA